MPRTVPLPVLPLPPQGPRAAALDHDQYEKKEKCGVVGLWLPSGSRGFGHADTDAPRSVASAAYYGLYAQQHRGQEAAGIAVSDGHTLSGVTGTGLVVEVFDPETLAKLDADAGVHRSIRALNGYASARPKVAPSNAPGSSAAVVGRGAIGHNRYSTAGGSLACNAQPLLENYVGGQVALAHNGNLINADLHRRLFEEAGHLFHTTSDTEVIIHLLASPQQQGTPDPVAATLRRLEGAFSLLFLFPDRIEACRDPWGWRPLVLGRTADGCLVAASETVALDVLEAELIREVEPGEIVTLSDAGVSTRRFSAPAERPAHCVFEHVYFANPASSVFGQNVQIARETMGERLAHESPALCVDGTRADFVVPMPDSGRSAAVGYARASGIPFREAIVPNRYVGRTFIKPTPEQRSAAVRLKLNVISEIVAGKRLVIVDDSIVRGTTTRTKIDQIRAAGAKEIHLRISCPPIRHPCYFGVDFATREQLIANGRTVEDIRKFLGVDSLAYLSLDGLLACMKRPGHSYCTACYSGDYRLDIDHPSSGNVGSSQLAMF